MAKSTQLPTTASGTVKRAALYTRVSSLKQEQQGASLETQEAACRQYCADQGWQVLEPHVYRETHKRSLLHERPLMTRLREAAREGAFDVVVCYCVDRLSSQDAHVYILDEEFGRAGVEMAFATEDFEQSAIGRFVRSAKVLAAAIEVEKIRERTVRGRIARVQSGKLIPGGKPLYGYQWADERDHKGKLVRGRLVEDPATAPIVRRIFEELAAGTTLMRLTAALTDEGVPTPTRRSTKWHASTIAAMAHKPAYKGDAYGWGWRKGGTTPQTFDPEKAIRLPDGTIPPLISPQLWDAVQPIMQRNQARAVRSARNPEAALLRGGFVHCGHCGGSMQARPRSDGGVEYVCRRGNHTLGTCVRPTISCRSLDEAVWTRAHAILTTPQIVAQEIERLRIADPTVEDLANLDAALQRVERQQLMVAQSIALLDDADAAAPLVAQLPALAIQKRALADERILVEQRRATWDQAQKQLGGLEQWCQTVANNLTELSYEHKRWALDALERFAKELG